MTQKEMDALDQKIEALKLEVIKAKEKYDSLTHQMAALINQRYPERQEDAIKERFYDAYKRSGKTIDFIIDFIENADDEDDYWAE